MIAAFPSLLLPHLWSSRNRAARREPGDLVRAALFGAVGLGVCAALFYGAYWLTSQLAAWDELGDYLLRLGLSWIFLTFLAFSGVVTSLSTSTTCGCCWRRRWRRAGCFTRAFCARPSSRRGWS